MADSQRTATDDSRTMEENTSVIPPAAANTVDLDDDKELTHNKDYVGATLEIADGPRDVGTEVAFKQGGGTSAPAEMGVRKSDSVPAGLSRDRPGSAFGRASTVSVGSRTSTSGRIKTTDHSKELFFSKKAGSFENAVDICVGKILKSDIDGELRGAWLLTEIDHWDHERERMVLITDKTCLIVTFDFVTSKMKDFKRFSLQMVTTVQVGDFSYPEKSLMTKIHPRDHGGVRLYWGDVSNVTFGQRWNPFASDIPTATFSHHPLIYNPAEKETVTYNVDDFYESLIQAVKRTYKILCPERELVIKEQPIQIDSYLSVTSLVFNQSFLGFNRDRNGVSF